MKLNRIGQYGLIIILLLLPTLTLAASFPCNKAKTTIEKTICSDRLLNELDGKLGSVYKEWISQLKEPERSKWKQLQINWIKNRNYEVMSGTSNLRDSILDRILQIEKELDKNILKSVMANWTKDLELFEEYIHPSKDKFQAKDKLESCNDMSKLETRVEKKLIPNYFKRLFSISNENCTKVLHVYIGCMKADSRYRCDETAWRQRLIIENMESKKVEIVTDLDPTLTANWSAYHFPIAFTKDSRHVILKPSMLDPGAGGGHVRDNYYVVSVVRQKNLHMGKVKYLSTYESFFFNNYEKVFYTANSDKLPKYSQPGPWNNNGVIMVKDLNTLDESIFLEEPDTTYDIVSLDEQRGTITIKVTQHDFSCREEDCLYNSRKTVINRIVNLIK